MPACLSCTLSGGFLMFFAEASCLASKSFSESWTDFRRLAASATRSRDALTSEPSVSAFLTVSSRLPACFSSAMVLNRKA
jgi:hypothetical protein